MHKFTNKKQVVEDNCIASKPSNCDEALANYLIFKSRSESMAASYMRALKVALIMHNFLNKYGFVYNKTKAPKVS